MRLNSIILSAAVLCLAVSSCQKADDPIANENAEMIRFGVNGVFQTKAYTESTVTGIEANGFKVAGITSANVTLFNGHASKDNSVYLPDNGPFYYPSDGTVSFYGVYPISDSVSISSGSASISFTHDGEKDLIAAKAANVSKSADAVALTFDHKLSLMHFKAKGSDLAVKYKVKSVKVKVPKTGTYKFAENTWTCSADSTQTTYSATDVYFVDTASIAGAVTAMPSNPSISVEWETYTKQDVLIQTYSATKYLDSALEMGKESLITLILPNNKAENISFTVTVNQWVADDRQLQF